MLYDPLIRLMLSTSQWSQQQPAISILIFHRVLKHPDPLFPGAMHAERFESIIRWLCEWFDVVPLSEAVESLRSDSRPSRKISITFDDGYLDNNTCALPILKKHGVPATFFIATGYLNGGRMWNDEIIESVRSTKEAVLDLDSFGLGRLPVSSSHDKRSAIALLIEKLKYLRHADRRVLAHEISDFCNVRSDEELMMRDHHVREMLSAGMEIGAHTVDHPILATCDAREAREQIVGSRDYLRDLLRVPIALFAYPNGKPHVDYLPEHARMVKELGFSAAASTAAGATRSYDDAFELKRFTPWDQSRARFGVRLALNLLN